MMVLKKGRGLRHGQMDCDTRVNTETDFIKVMER
jgi:hypothetical protein